MLPERPHPGGTCMCDACAEWARAVVAAPTAKKPAQQLSTAVRDKMPLEEFMRSVIAIACKATGMTEEQLRAKAEAMGSDMPETTVERASRETVTARGVPEMHLVAVYDREPTHCDALTAVRRFLVDPQTLLVLSGGVGLRKTGSACWALTEKAGCFVKADELLRVAGSRDPDDVTQWRRARGTQVLVVDDLGGEYVDDKGWAVKVLNALFDFRYEHRLKTIVTTNLDAATFKATYGERITDRMREAGRWVNLGGQSVRRRA